MGIKERKEREKDRRRQQIVVAAKRVFSEKGYTRSTIEDIAQAAELSVGTLYLYFKSKEELFASLSLRVLQYLLIRIKEIDTEKNAASPLDQLKQAMVDVHQFDPEALINLFHLQSSDTLKNLSEAMLDELNSLTRKSVKAVSEVFEDGIQRKIFQSTYSPVVLADIFWSIFSGVILLETSKKMMNEKKDFIHQTLSAAFDIFGTGISVRSAPTP